MNSDKPYARSDLRYWREKVCKTKSSKGTCSPDFSVQIAFRGKRVRFPLQTPNRDAAAKRAQKIYLSLQANGWEATLAEFKPESFAAPRSATVGEYIEEASAVADIGARTFQDYVTSFRKIVGDITGNRPASRHVPVMKQWRENVDQIHLEQIDAQKVHRWKLDYVKRAGNDPVKQRSAKITANSFMRKSKALFGRKIRPYISKELILPEPLPLAGVSLFPRTSMRYVSRIDVKELIGEAGNCLGGSKGEDETVSDFELRLEVYKAFLLALFAGLRRKEIDTLLWRQVDFDSGTISIEATPYHVPKTEQSMGVLEIDPEIVDLLRGFRARAKGEFVIESATAPQLGSSYSHYRAMLVFQRLTAWLRENGLDDQKPLHALRKEAGSIVCQNSGLFAASRFLRHADIHITAQHYVDKRERVTVGLGSLLATNVDRQSLNPNANDARSA